MPTSAYNVYCDESCHMLKDHNKVFVLGAVWADKEKIPAISEELRQLKARHGLAKNFEAKWTKISKGKVDYYTDLVKYFFDNNDLHFRGVVVPDKSLIDHAAFGQDHNTWYYKMFYLLLSVVVRDAGEYNLYLDMKDSKSNQKIRELKRILNIASGEDTRVARAQQVRSNEVEVMQITDLLAGALSYTHRGLTANQGKTLVLEAIESNAGKKMLSSTARNEDKFNVLVWKPRQA